MTKGAQRADAQFDSDEAAESLPQQWLGPADLGETEDGPTPPRGGRLALAVLLWIAALAWVGLALWQAFGPGGGGGAALLAGLPALSAPLILLGVVWMIFGRTGSREARRFNAAVARMREETAGLDGILAVVSARLEERHALLTGDAERLMALGDEASDRLGRVAHYLSKESAGLDALSSRLESAAGMARVDIGVLLSDLPRAEAQAHAAAEGMKQAGLAALGEAGHLESQLSALIARGREADEVVGGTAQRLAAQVARIESGTEAAKARLDEATGAMTQAVDDSLARTAEAVTAARTGLDAQSRGMLAMVESSRAALETAGSDAARDLGQRLDAIGGRLETFSGQLAAQDAASAALLGRLSQDLAELDERLTALGRTGDANAHQLGGALDALRQRAQELETEIGGGQQRSAALLQSAGDLGDALAAVGDRLREIDRDAVSARGSAEALAPVVEAVQVAACDAAAQGAAAEASLARQQEMLDRLVGGLRGHVEEAEARLRGLAEAAEEAAASSGRLAEETGPQLVDALLRVREAASQAAERARETIAAVIPASAAALGEASREAARTAISETLEAQVAELAILSERASETARAASERLTRQMLGIGEAAASVEARIDAARAAREDAEGESFARRAALLTESLNSTAIDVAKLLSSEPTDAQWAAYLKGERGVFTRRAVRLLSRTDARAIARLYDDDPEFRAQVGRYVADFEALLRRVTSERDGDMLAVAILSSDMGKLYVALAQGTARLRA